MCMGWFRNRMVASVCLFTYRQIFKMSKSSSSVSVFNKRVDKRLKIKLTTLVFHSPATKFCEIRFSHGNLIFMLHGSAAERRRTKDKYIERKTTIQLSHSQMIYKL